MRQDEEIGRVGEVGGFVLGDAGGVVRPILEVGNVFLGGGVVGQDLVVPVQAVVCYDQE